AGADPGEGADERGEGDRDDRDAQRVGHAGQAAGEDVAPELVGAEPVRAGRPEQPVLGLLGDRVVGGQPEHGGERRADHQRDEHDANQAGGAAQQPPPRARAGRLGSERDLLVADGGGHEARTRGSMTRYSRSVSRFTSTNVTAMTSTVLCTSAYSFCWMPASTCRPMPGTEKICSTTIAPPSR